MQILKAIGALLTYPGPELKAALPEIGALVRDDRQIPMRQREALARLIGELSAGDSWTWQEDYVATFDRGRATSLHLFEHVHGESRERGQALIDLREQYLKAGLALNPGELPDYLPVFLEYVASLPVREARAQLADVLHILQGLFTSLAQRRSAYAPALAALIVLGGGKLPPVSAGTTPDAVRHAEDAEATDREWEEQPAFGPVAACKPSAGPQPVHFIPRPVPTGALR